MSNEHYVVYRGHRDVALAAMQRSYIPLLLPGANDPEVTKGVLLRPPVTLEAEYAWYDRLVEHDSTDQIFAILLRAGPTYRYIGHTGLHRIVWPAAHGSTGSLIVNKELFGQGYGTEAKLLLLHHAFHVVGLHKVTSEVKAFNAQSWGHLLKCGYRVVGRRKDHHFHDGTYVDEVVLEVFRKDWEPIWERYQETRRLPSLSKKQRKEISKQ